MLPVYGKQRGLCYLSEEGGVVLDGRQRGLCYLFMGDRGVCYLSELRKEVLYWIGGREDYVTCLWEAERTMLPV